MESGARIRHVIVVLIMMKWFVVAAILAINVTNTTELEPITAVNEKSTVTLPKTIASVPLSSTISTLNVQKTPFQHTTFTNSSPHSIIPKNLTNQTKITVRQQALFLTTTSTPPCTNVTLLVSADKDGACCFPTSAAFGISTFLMVVIVCLLFMCCFCVVRAMNAVQKERDTILREYENRIEREKRIAAMNIAKSPMSFIVTPSQRHTRSHIKPKAGPIKVETSVGTMAGLICYFAQHPVPPDVDVKHRAEKIDIMLMPQMFDNKVVN